MHELIERAKGAVEGAELYWQRAHTISVDYENGRLQQITENDLSSVALRVIEHGKMGSTFAVSPDQDGLIEQAKRAAAHGDPATFSFAPAAKYADVGGFAEETDALTSEDLVSLCEGTLDALRAQRDDLTLSVGAEAETRTLVIETTEGAEARHRATDAMISLGAPIKGAGMGVYKWRGSVGPQTQPDDLIDEFLTWYRWTETTSTPPTGRLPILFAPEAAFLYLLPLWAGIEGNAVERGTSPLCDRLGEQILSEQLTILDAPTELGAYGARPFDDEGIPCRTRPIIERGVLNEYLLDLQSASALGREPTGNAVKRELFSGGTETKPSPWPIRLSVEAGSRSYREILAGIGEGILVYFGLGFHSGNYPQGQFAVQAVGFHIQGGEIAGRLENTMISGDIYKDLKHVREVSAERGPALGFLQAQTPFVLVDGLQVAGA